MAGLGSIYSSSRSRQLMDSFKEIGAFSHSYTATSGTEVGKRCKSYNDVCKLYNDPGSSRTTADSITAISIDNEGKHIASATLEGCITVHKFEELYSASQKFSSVTEEVDDQSKHLMHINVGLKVVSRIKWNPQNSEQMACTWRKLMVYDLNDVHHPTEYILDKDMRHKPRFEDLSFSPTNSLISACYKYLIMIWDPRVSKSATMALFPKHDIMACQFGKDDKTIFAAGEGGKVFGWDLRCYDLICDHESSPPIWELPGSKLNIRDDEVRISSLLFNPSNRSQLAFNIENGWCGVLDTANFQIKLTHAHPLKYNYPKPSSWLGESSIFAIPDGENTLRLMDFHLSSESPCYMDSSAEEAAAANPNLTHRDIVCSQKITCCAGHPFINSIVVGTERSSLMLITQESSYEGEQEM